jgi:tetratricopeptide (TPR) repeat protein
MTLIKFRPLGALCLALLLGAPVFSQSAQTGTGAPHPLDAEVRAIAQSLETNRNGRERRELYIKLAQLQRLSGNVDAAARSWREAARADPANRDNESLLESSLCYLALGEFDAASDVLREILAGVGANTPMARDAQYIGAQIELFRSGSPASLYALLARPEYAMYRPAIYYTFWRLFGDEAYRTQILTEFPGSPEARILESEAAFATSLAGSPGRVSAQARALWFFHPGRGNVVIGPPIQQYELSPAPAPSGSSGPRALQTGLFSQEEHALASADRLFALGFATTVNRKLINGVVYWAVSVAPGEDANWTTMRLKDAGFESFPVF